MTALTEEQIAVWRERETERKKDVTDIAFNYERDERRREVRQEMSAFLADFLSGDLSLKQFKDTFDRKTRKDWDVFGLKGMSGAMFLNTLVIHLPDQDAITEQLRQVLPVPSSAQEGRSRLQVFYQYLMALTKSGVATRRQVQPVRAMFFVSSWWHLQSPEQWPPHYISAQRALSADNLYSDSGDPVADYFVFREVFLELMDGLGLPAWEVEHLLGWYEERPGPPAPTPDPLVVPIVEPDTADTGTEPPTPAESSVHTRVQWQLARLGSALNCQVWIASNDHSRTHNGQRLGALSVAALPNLGMDDDTRQIIGLIDVIWLHGKKVVAAFEIESTTSIFSGILRMSDLLAVSPNISFPLYLVVPEERAPAVRRQLCRETFKALELPERCRYFTFEALQANFEGMAQWATGPEAVRKLARRVECVE